MLAGGNGADQLKGSAGADRLSGGNGADILNGQAGNDVFDGGRGNHTLTGGNGAETLLFTDALHTDGDRITDLRSNQGDVIELAGIDAREDRGGNQVFDLISDAAFSSSTGELRLWSGNGKTHVAGDTDGDGAADFTLFLNAVLTLGADDIVL